MNMNKFEKRQTGFSLVEVLFAVMILSMGLIFVAAQFPVGLMIAKETSEDTLNAIHAHNAEIMTELQVGTIPNTAAFAAIYNTTSGKVHAMPQPNVKCDIYNDINPDAFYDNSTAIKNNFEICLDNLEGFIATFNADIPYWTETADQDYTSDFIGDMGGMVCPTVDASDPDVQDLMAGIDQATNPNYGYLQNKKIFAISMERNYCWSALYRVTPPNTLTLYTFTLRCKNKNARYAMQDDATTGSITPLQLAKEDRKFPAPWRISLENAVDPTDTAYFSLNGPWDRFLLKNYTFDDDHTADILALLRVGSVLVDADAGHIYEINEIKDISNTNNPLWQVRFKTDLDDNDPLLNFWVFPPAIEWAESTIDDPVFAEQQPVMQVTEKIVRF